MHHVDEGDGEPIVLVHGNPTWSFMYRKVIEAFRERHRVIAFDQLGMGLSERLPKSGERRSLEERIEDFGYFMDNIEGLSDIPVRLVSHDWGGPVALGWAVRNPGRVRSIVLMNTGVRIPPGFRLPWRLAIFKKWGFLGDFLIEKLGLFTKGLLDVGTVRPLSRNAREGLIAPYVKSSLRGSAAGFVRDIPLSEERPSWETLKSLGLGLPKLNRKPILLVWGMRDFVFGPRFLYDLKKRFPQARVLPLPHSGHWALEDEPQKVLHALRLFWGRAGESP
jgi:haloalkane dehalogenase